LKQKIKNTGDKITSIGRGEIEGRALWGIIVGRSSSAEN